MDDAANTRFRREHRIVQQELIRLGRIVATVNRAPGDRVFLQALGELVETCDRSIEPHLAIEERSIYPCLRECLPADAVDAAMREHETLRDLMGLLRLRSRRLRSREPDAEAEIAETIRDLATLWRAHAHRVDEVVGPLLKRLREEPHA